MANLARFRQVMEDFGKVADFVTVYIAEAHPTDGWHIPGNLEVANHKTIEERFTAAKKMLDLEPLDCPVLIDSFTDDTNKAYNGLPERLYIVQDGVIVYQGAQGPFGYKLKEVEAWLKDYKGE